MATVYNKQTKENALKNVNPNKMPDFLIKQLSFKDAKPRDFGDHLVSMILEEELPSYPLKNKNYLEMYLNDLKHIKPEHRVDKVLVFDTETTGINGYIVSIALSLYSIKEDKVLKEGYFLVNPNTKIEQKALEVHGINEDEIKDKPSFKELWSEVEHFFNDFDMIVGQNVIFDLMVLNREFERINMVTPIEEPYIFDTMKMSKDIVKAKDKNGRRVKDPSLSELVDFFHIKIEENEQQFHNALFDVQMTLEVFKKLINFEF